MSCKNEKSNVIHIIVKVIFAYPNMHDDRFSMYIT